MIDDVDRTLKIWRSTSFRWGYADCLISIANYVLLRTGQDYGAPYRGRYSDAAGATEFIARAGSEVALIDQAGLQRTDKPGRGDIVLAVCHGATLAGLCTGPAVAFRAERGVAEINRHLVKITHAWRVP